MPPVRPYPTRGSVRNPSGEIMPLLGFVTCSVKIGDRNYDQEFIVKSQFVGVMLMCTSKQLLVRFEGIPNSLTVNERRHVIQTKSFLMCRSGLLKIQEALI